MLLSGDTITIDITDLKKGYTYLILCIILKVAASEKRNTVICKFPRLLSFSRKGKTKSSLLLIQVRTDRPGLKTLLAKSQQDSLGSKI